MKVAGELQIDFDETLKYLGNKPYNLVGSMICGNGSLIHRFYPGSSLQVNVCVTVIIPSFHSESPMVVLGPLPSMHQSLEP